MNVFAQERPEDIKLAGSELVGASPKEQEVMLKRARIVFSHRHAAAALFFNFVEGARGASVHDKSMVVYGGGGLFSAVVNYLGGRSPFWWNVWLILIHVIVFVLAVLVVLKTVRAEQRCCRPWRWGRGRGRRDTMRDSSSCRIDS